MNQLTEIKQPIDQLAEAYRPYILAQAGKSLRENTHPDNLEAIYRCIVIAFEYLGHANKNEDRKVNMFLAEEFYKMISQKYPHAKHNEIELAFKKLAVGDYNHVFPKDKFLAINVNSLWTAWKTYHDSEELKQAKREWLKLNDAPVSEKTTIDLKEEMRGSILNAYKEFLETGEVPVCGGQYYAVLCKIKGVKTVIEDKAVRAEIRQKAFEIYDRSLKAKKVEKGTYETLMKTALEGLNASYDSQSRKLALKYYFTECKTLNKQPI